MRTPRRVQWATRTELHELYELIFAPSADESSKMRGLERMSVYISSPSCPAFLPILYALVSADLLPPPRNVIEAQSTRLSCGMAIVRLINGMVDPLQTGPYARPISHLAATLHIPPSLISLRHRATHEDLPPLPLLRTSVVQCISYIHTYSFLPLLAESSSQPAIINDRAIRLIARYKRISKDKARDRDVDESGPRAKELRRIKRALEVEDTQDLVEALCTTEGIVPVARKKRPSSRDTEPTEGVMHLWMPLIRHLAPYHPNLPSAMGHHIAGMLLEPMQGGGGGKEEVKEQNSFRWSLAVWLIWAWRGDVRELRLTREDKSEIWGRLLPVLMQAPPFLRRLASCLAEADPSVASGWFQLESMLPTAPGGDHGELRGLIVDDGANEGGIESTGEGPSLDGAYEQMQARMAQFEQMMSSRKTAPAEGDRSPSGCDLSIVAPGWRRLTAKEWRPCPIGMSGLA